MSDYEKNLDTYRAKIAEFDARARALKKGWISADDETKQREAVQLAEQARGLHVALDEFVRTALADD